MYVEEADVTWEPTVITLENVQRRRAVDAMTRAFAEDPMWSCILPDRARRLERLPAMWDALIGFARVYGVALTTPEGKGAACWISPGRTSVTLWQLLRTGMALPRSMMALPKDARGRFFRMMRFIEDGHKELMNGPHWYLWALGVAPEAQGQGIGRALLRPVLERADAGGHPCYLETQSEANVAFYRGSGFEVEAQRSEPVGDLPIWFMVRPPTLSR
jgi:ribosomal protein S18 acetylase RimI-like enzyme